MSHILVNVAWPYANGPRHIGHVAGFGVPSDVYARYERMKGNDVLMVSGTDEHGTPILVEADKEGVSAQELANRYNRVIANDLCDLGLSYDLFTRTTTGNHEKVVQELFKQCLKNGYIYKGTQKVAISPSTGRTLPDRYIEGTCPICGADGARGDQCDDCGNELDPDELINPVSKINGEVPRFEETEHFFLDLPALAEANLAWLKTRKDWRTNVINFSIGLFKEVKPRAITRDIDWGIPVPVKDWIDNPNKKLYVWFDAVIGYLSASIEWARRKGDPEAWRAWWNDPSTPGYYFMGKDNITFHSQIWPSEMLAYNGQGSKGGETGELGPLNMPEQVVASEFMTMEGKKFSSSRGIVIYVKDILSRYPVDAVRYYISIAGPESSDSNFTWSEFVRHNNEELASSWGNLVNRVANLIAKNFGEIPAIDENEMTDEDRALLDETREAFATAGNFIESHHQKAALLEAMRVVGDINKYISATEPWKIKDNPARLGTVLHVAAQAVSDANHLLAPFLPHASQKVWEALGGKGTFSPLPHIEEVEDLDKPGFKYPIITGDYKLGVNVHPWESEPIEVGAPVAKPTPIFAKIPVEAVQEELDRFSADLAARKEAEAERLAAEKAKLAN
ncbi:MAG: methionine--tRNA ligase [Bifidobacterium merycicum]|uniref:Methionine--tRNA ligase n=1 Tax=Bifidobacterium merycicum TaxID=78345 RepID=A0A087BD28_9BIFI|nr:methionine--tRNA ligase [Bifidobacterium merycicum]MBQ1514071.1 methionine--tRNA ligase [Bifidobacterium sp.]MEE0970741.1 methionine--tRNA ligase [Bifidobacterium ruminantium]KFI68928.1 methionyl-tRNA synthetase [Bifidobacterium merycicum]MEE1293723.1 methionine--tRNA ligase [Bifidobacterium merycicum]MEE3341160.1 methionine--tRNA ligase [Bifidobacterium merycicum]